MSSEAASWDHFKVLCKLCKRQIMECPCRIETEKFTRWELCDKCEGSLQDLDPNKLVSPAKPKKGKR